MGMEAIEASPEPPRRVRKNLEQPEQKGEQQKKIQKYVKQIQATGNKTPSREQPNHQSESPKDVAQGDSEGDDSHTTKQMTPRKKKDEKVNTGNDRPRLQSPSPSPCPSPSPSSASTERATYLLKLARSSHISGEKPSKTLEYAWQAANMWESLSTSINSISSEAEQLFPSTPSLELVMSLHIVAAAQYRMGRYEEAAGALEKTLESLSNGSSSPFSEVVRNEYSLATFAGYMQLGDTYSKLGKQSKALESYSLALAAHKQATGELHPQVGETYRYLAEAYLQAMRLSEAEEMCEQLLRIHSHNKTSGGIQEASDRRLMALVNSARGQYDRALENLNLAAAAVRSAPGAAPDRALFLAGIDSAAGDCHAALGRLDDAAGRYTSAVDSLRVLRGESHASLASLYTALADVALRAGRATESRSWCDKSLRIFGSLPSSPAPGDAAELAAGMAAAAGVLEALSEREEAVRLLRRAVAVAGEAPPAEARAVAATEAQLGVVLAGAGRMEEAVAALEAAVEKLREAGDGGAAVTGVVLNQMGIVLFEMGRIEEGVEVLEDAQVVLGEACGASHPDTVAVCSNLAGGYDALGRVDDAIELLEKVVRSEEERVGTVDPDVVEMRLRLEEMLRECGRPVNHKSSSLEELLKRTAQSKRYQLGLV